MRTERVIWYALLAPPTAWALQEWLGWFFGARTCGSLAPASVRWTVLGISLGALVVGLVGMSRSWTIWRHVTTAEGVLAADAQDRVEFMALGGFLVSTIFVIAIAWAALTPAFIGDCGWIR